MEQSCRTIQCDQARTNVIDRQNDDQTIEAETSAANTEAAIAAAAKIPTIFFI